MISLLLAIASSALVAITMRIGQGKTPKTTALLWVNYVLCLLFSWADTGFAAPFPGEAGLPFALMTGAVNGFLFLSGFLLLPLSIRKNGVVLSSTFMKLGLLVSMLVSVLFFKERPGLLQWLGFAMAVAAIVLINYDPKNAGKTGSLALLLGLTLSGGMGDAMAKVFEALGNPALGDHFILYTFFSALVLCTILMLRDGGLPGKKELLYGTIIGVPNFFSAKFLLAALTQVPGMIVYPVTNVGVILTVTLTGVAVFGERLQKKQWVAMGMILLALVLLNL